MTQSMDQFSAFIFASGDPPPTAQELVDAAVLAEELGFYSVSLAHHLVVPTTWVYGGLADRDLIDPLVMLPAIAANTTTIRIGTNSAIAPLLPPVVWAKYFASLDVLSQGRVICGMAMGWFDRDFAAVGVDRRKRGAMFDEQLDVITRLWTEESVTYNGQFYRLENVNLVPKPAQKPHPPIWIGGFLPSLNRASRYARYLVPGNLTTEQISRDYVPRLREATGSTGCNTELCLNINVDIMGEGKEPDVDTLARLKRAVNFFDEPDIQPKEVAIVGSPQTCARRIMEYQDAGVAHFLLDFQYHGAVSIGYAMEQMKLFADRVVPSLK